MAKGMKLLFWTIIGVASFTVGSCLLFQAIYYLSGRGPSALVLHVGGDWDQVKITSASYNLESSLIFKDPMKPIRVEQIGYGPYKIGIQYRDKKTLWLECYHIDAGMAKTIEVTVKREGDAPKAAVQTICAQRGYQPSVDFSDEVTIDQTNEEMPCRIWGGP